MPIQLGVYNIIKVGALPWSEVDGDVATLGEVAAAAKVRVIIAFYFSHIFGLPIKNIGRDGYARVGGVCFKIILGGI